MEENKIVSILSALASGVNPTTGEIFGHDSPYQSTDVVRALYAAIERLKSQPAQAPAQPDQVKPNEVKSRVGRPNGPSNAGKPWSDEEDRRLLAEFDRGRRPNEIARDLGRTLTGIEARLERHGRLSASERTTTNRYSKDRPGEHPLS